MKSFWFTQPFVPYAQVENSSHYKILDDLVFLKIEQFLKTLQVAQTVSEDHTRCQIW